VRDDDGGGGGGVDRFPGGNWRATCQDAHIYNSVLYARCRDGYGAWHDASIDLRQCRNDVSNVGGRMVCAYDDGGSYQRITLYRHSGFYGAARSFSDDVPDLRRYGFADIASSVVIAGGAWQLCSRPYYRGRCIVLTRTQSTLDTVSFDDMAESLRRVRY